MKPLSFWSHLTLNDWCQGVAKRYRSLVSLSVSEASGTQSCTLHGPLAGFSSALLMSLMLCATSRFGVLVDQESEWYVLSSACGLPRGTCWDQTRYWVRWTWVLIMQGFPDVLLKQLHQTCLWCVCRHWRIWSQILCRDVLFFQSS